MTESFTTLQLTIQKLDGGGNYPMNKSSLGNLESHLGGAFSLWDRDTCPPAQES